MIPSPAPWRLLAVVVTLASAMVTSAAQAPQPRVDPLAARVDPYVEKQRVVVMTDIANEPDDQMSMVRFLVYSNEFDVEGLVADDVDVDAQQGAARRDPARASTRTSRCSRTC